MVAVAVVRWHGGDSVLKQDDFSEGRITARVISKALAILVLERVLERVFVLLFLRLFYFFKLATRTQ